MVVGGGPAGYACALRVADHGLSVALVEADKVGGTCLHRGCVPTRAMLQAASFADAVGAPAMRWGIHATIERIEMAQVLSTRDEVVNRNHRAVQSHLASSHIEVLRGRGRLADTRTVVIEGDRVEAKKAVVLAMGSIPRRFAAIEPDGERILTSDQAMGLTDVPKSALILGGGAVGSEFSQVWRAFGSEVTIIERGPRLVPFEDEAVGEALARALRRRGIHSLVSAHTKVVNSDENGVTVELRIGDRITTRTADVLLLAAGRDPATSDAGLYTAGIELKDGYVPVNWSSLETDAAGVYAVGDLLPSPSQARAHVAYAEGMLAGDHIGGRPTTAIDYVNVPRITHGLIESACVGMTELQAREEGYEIDVRLAPISSVAKGLMVGEPGMTKVIAHRRGPVIGVHMVGPNAAELIGEAAAMVNYEATPAEAAELVRPHPTLSENAQELYLAMAGRPLHQR